MSLNSDGPELPPERGLTTLIRARAHYLSFLSGILIAVGIEFLANLVLTGRSMKLAWVVVLASLAMLAAGVLLTAFTWKLETLNRQVVTAPHLSTEGERRQLWEELFAEKAKGQYLLLVLVVVLAVASMSGMVIRWWFSD